MGLYGTTASTISDIALTLEVLIMAVFFAGAVQARRHDANRHYKIMTAGFLLNLAFVFSYMAKSILEGGTKFKGPPEVYGSVYLPLVIVHGIAALSAFFLAGYTVYYGYTRSVKDKKRAYRRKEQYWTHRKLGYTTLAVWFTALATGILVYLFLYVIYA